MGDHTEALQIDYDPSVLDYDTLLDMVWSAHDPTRAGFSIQYRAAIWCTSDEQLALARQSGERAARARGGSLATAVEPFERFYRAEDYHQKYRLRRERALLAELIERYGSDRAMVDSTAAARLNGLLSGYGRRGDVARLLPLLELSPKGEQALQSRLRG